jgi:serine/threonine-protein kinase
MAEIFLARQRGLEGLDRTVVIKRILPELSKDDEFITMFLDEARLMAALSHPHIAQVFDLGFAEESYYLVMEYVRGPTLGEMLSAARANASRLPEAEALSIARAVAEAVAYLHGRHDEFGRPLEIVHRDVNPSNVIVSYEGAVKLIDFGIAKNVAKVHETRTGVIKGTFGYVAPEQITQRAPVDHRADVYSIGVLLYEMCVGHHPFAGGRQEDLVRRMLNAEYPRPGTRVPGFSPVLERIITSCMSPGPEERPQQVQTLVDELAAYVGGQGRAVTMRDVGRLAHGLVPDEHGPAPLRPLLSSQTQRGAAKSGREQDETGTMPLGKAPGRPRPPAGPEPEARDGAADGTEEPTLREGGGARQIARRQAPAESFPEDEEETIRHDSAVFRAVHAAQGGPSFEPFDEEEEETAATVPGMPPVSAENGIEPPPVPPTAFPRPEQGQAQPQRAARRRTRGRLFAWLLAGAVAVLAALAAGYVWMSEVHGGDEGPARTGASEREGL